MREKPHLLITGVRRPGHRFYRFRIYGYPESEFPPIDLETTLRGLRRWMPPAEPPLPHRGPLPATR